MPKSLYRIWQQRVAETPDETALIDAPTGESLTFSELDASLGAPSQFPRGMSPRFIQQTLAAWREGSASVPIEKDSPSLPDSLDIPSGIAHVKTTSGSTGTPRYIFFSAEQLAADADNIVRTMGLSKDRPNIGVISMAHSYGFSNLVLPLVLHGIPLILGGDPLPASFQRALTFLPKTGGTVPAVPAMWRAWLKSGCLDPHRIKTAISAGAPLTTDLETAIYEETGIKVHNFYGSSECGGIAYDRSDRPRTAPDCVGIPMDGIRVSTNADNCLIASGKSVGSAYWPESDDTALGAGKFITQDLAEIAADGLIRLRGRASDLINIAGRKLDPSSIEAHLLKHPDVHCCVVFSIESTDPERVQEIVAIANAGDEIALRAHLGKLLPAWQKVRHWWITPSLIQNTRGKISRNEWRKKWQEKARGGR